VRQIVARRPGRETKRADARSYRRRSGCARRSRVSNSWRLYERSALAGEAPEKDRDLAGLA